MKLDAEQVGEAFRARMSELQSAMGCATQKDFADALGTYPSKVNNWLRVSQPSLGSAVEIAQAAGVSLEWLAGISDAGGPDLVIYEDGKPVGVVEVKARPAGEARVNPASTRRAAQAGGADASARVARSGRGKRAAGQ